MLLFKRVISDWLWFFNVIGFIFFNGLIFFFNRIVVGYIYFVDDVMFW